MVLAYVEVSPLSR